MSVREGAVQKTIPLCGIVLVLGRMREELLWHRSEGGCATRLCSRVPMKAGTEKLAASS